MLYTVGIGSLPIRMGCGFIILENDIGTGSGD